MARSGGRIVQRPGFFVLVGVAFVGAGFLGVASERNARVVFWLAWFGGSLVVAGGLGWVWETFQVPARSK